MKKHSILTLAVAAAIAAAPAVQAQSADPTSVPSTTVWSDNAGGQLAHLLTSPSAAVREKGLDLALRLAGRSDLDLAAASEPLLTIYQTSGDEASRLAALAALVAIGDEEAMQVVRRDVARQDAERVRVATLGALASYYGTDTFSRDADVAAMADGLRGYAAR
jgi:hypothetical protein